MAKVCHSCGKGPAFGHSRSHSMVATKRRFNPNLQKVRIDVGTAPRRVYVCTRCLKAGKVPRPSELDRAVRGHCVAPARRPPAEGDRGVAVTDPNLVRFRAAVAGALAQLEARRQEVNDLNVFPVADGDTGDNMAQTLRAVMEELDRLIGATASARSTRSAATRSCSRSRARRCSARAATAA